MKRAKQLKLAFFQKKQILIKEVQHKLLLENKSVR